MYGLSVLTRQKLDTMTLLKHMAVAISVGLLYFGILMTNPLGYLTGMASLTAFAKIRWANLLRPLVLSFPSAAFGIAGASYMWSVYTGKIVFGGYTVMPFVHLGITLFCAGLAAKMGRSTIKDLAALAIMGAMMGIVVVFHHTSIAMLLDNPQLFTRIFTLGALWKIANHVLVLWAGYPIARYIDGRVKQFKQKRM